MKKKYFGLLLCLLFSFVSFELINACSLSDLKSCDRAGLVSLIKELIIKKQALNNSATKNKFQASTEVFLPDDLKKTMISKVEEKLGYKIEYGDSYFENKLFKGSFKKPFAEEYLLVAKYTGPMVSSGIFFGLFDIDKNLIAVGKIGGGSHSFSDFNVYNCNKNGLNLIFAEYMACSNGSPYCFKTISLNSFNDDGFYDFQKVIEQNKTETVVQGGEISVYKWKEFDYSDKASYDDSEAAINEENCKKIGCRRYWYYPPYAKGYLLFDRKLAYNENSCMFESVK
jgi:hypothetical protein